MSRAFPLALIVVAMLALQWAVLTVEADDIQLPGVKAGDRAKYRLTIDFTSNDPRPPVIPAPPEYNGMDYEIEVNSVVGTNITYTVKMYLTNGTQIAERSSTDIRNPNVQFFVFANLSAGDKMYDSPDAPLMNSTSIRFYAGAEREVVHLEVWWNWTIRAWDEYDVLEELDCYWDRQSGIFTELNKTAICINKSNGCTTRISSLWRMLVTNIWDPTFSKARLLIVPRVVNAKGRGRWIMAIVVLRYGFDGQNVDVTSIRLNGTVGAEKAIKLGRLLIVRFDRETLVKLALKDCGSGHRFAVMTMTMTGQLIDGSPFEGSDTIRVVLPKYGASAD